MRIIFTVGLFHKARNFGEETGVNRKIAFSLSWNQLLIYFILFYFTFCSDPFISLMRFSPPQRPLIFLYGCTEMGRGEM